MSHPGPGRYDRQEMWKGLRLLSPHESVDTVLDVNLAEMKAAGKKLVLLDVDNTLLEWKSEEFSPEVMSWIEAGRDLGFQFCILSNTRHPERLERISKKVNVEHIRDRFKPHPRMYQMALEKYGVAPEEAVMIGDQLLTDVLGANRCGIDAIWVQPIGKREFLGTKHVSRNIERFVAIFLRKYFQGTKEDEKSGFFGSSILKQLLKFGVVGGTATVIDLGIHYFLMFKASYGGQPLRETVGTWWINTFQSGADPAILQSADHLKDAAFAPLKVGPVLLAIFVSYLLNRAWTFKSTESMSLKQAGKFYIVALIGMVISVIASSLVNRYVHGSELASWGMGSAAGIVAGFAWNFNAQRLWTFKSK